ncbi:UDP-glucose:glycoprotein glucosyltransferase 2-like, partial [Tupaia chinensis]|uniref:UDP-glucose:glycoprotein glucosyltransferase 2-like n=1 Tax=Tupaia chinensis TaxID=246437 RepID=UPI000FFBE963
IIKMNPLENSTFFDVIANVDPLTRGAQKMAQLLVVLGKVINMKIGLFMNSRRKLSEAPLQSFYRFVLEPELMSGVNNVPSLGPMAKFLDIPESPLLTLNMITPEGWLVEIVHSNCDLDNIHLKDGYFQLKANPGAWILKLRQGKSEDIYQIVGYLCFSTFTHKGTDSEPELGHVIVVLNSFKSKILEVQVQKKPDRIKEDILTEKDEKRKGVWDSIKRIMMLSVLCNTKTPVKFWFLKNSLSPTFKIDKFEPL